MDFEQAIEARFVRRVNRFVAEIALKDGRLVEAHVANTGRMPELLVSQTPCLIRPAKNLSRKTAWDLLAVDYEDQWVCLVATWANDMVAEWLESGLIDGFETATNIKREKKIGGSRFDFALEMDEKPWLIEVKSVNYVIEGHALFPDAPTSRGRRHVEELLALQADGWQVGVFFVTMGQTVVDVTFNDKNDPEFAETMRQAIANGMTAKAFSAKIDPTGVQFLGERPIIVRSQIWKSMH